MSIGICLLVGFACGFMLGMAWQNEKLADDFIRATDMYSRATRMYSDAVRERIAFRYLRDEK